ncbi:hypothetical protein RVF83_04450 [Gordonia rubripertincta]|uniref:Uncharacterized protein n=2 Tax=Gordonia rubripertincta TaxID=36822 RepID=A0AAW4FZA8_GORRU|nr:hypothetical protein [Gordonia rubripertincta]MBM7276442.1 hypothetical protein [Gordonia rubripertincta]MDG6782257.1 hypothetical protein [Gordonia rubripertincta]NKY65006.1 hypothetical protein [Gordonia rubripertincta]TSD95199.1 hypothetical protein FOV72_14960 [Gordonia rubripertincta]GAB84694.1 hypothetical protein GORBP_044_00140 [Gordonia rubripertincta NBRC 101908]
MDRGRSDDWRSRRRYTGRHRGVDTRTPQEKRAGRRDRARQEFVGQIEERVKLWLECSPSFIGFVLGVFAGVSMWG